MTFCRDIHHNSTTSILSAPIRLGKKHSLLSLLPALVIALLCAPAAAAQSLFDELIVEGETVAVPADAEGGMVVLPGMTLPTDTTINVDDQMFSPVFYMPMVFDHYDMRLSQSVPDPLKEKLTDRTSPMSFFDRVVTRNKRQRLFMQEMMANHPEIVRYNMATMPRPPKKFVMHLDPTTAKLTVEEFKEAPVDSMKGVVPETEVKRIYWLHSFSGSLQFSQAYVSPNWYQGGKSNLNMIANAIYDIQLNPKFNNKVIFDATVAYKLGLNNAPDDTLHAYNISEDLLQINTKFGLKAHNRWYYSVNAQFKTQLLNSYQVNTDNLKSSFLSPGELNIGVGMTYNYENKRKTLQFAASIAPLSYNLKTCTNPNLNPTAFGIEEGHTSKSEYGSSVEMTLKWNIGYNVTYFSRLFAFTNYEYVQADWEHTLDFNINRFMSARVYAHFRYDSQAERMEDSRWNKIQVKEILSIGFSYKFSRL